jgi:hypothetical protein
MSELPIPARQVQQVMSPNADDKVHIEKLKDRDNFMVWKFSFDILADSMELGLGE